MDFENKMSEMIITGRQLIYNKICKAIDSNYLNKKGPERYY